jgi:exonuclease VII small subunit
MPNLIPHDLPQPVPGGPVFPPRDEQAAQSRAIARNIELKAKWQRESDEASAKRAAAQNQNLERLSDAAAHDLLKTAEDGLETIKTATLDLQNARDSAAQIIKDEERAIDALRAAHKEAMQLFVTRPGAARPPGIDGELDERHAKLDMSYAAFQNAESLYKSASDNFLDATRAARAVIHRAVHHLLLNAADRLTDRLEQLTGDAKLCAAALEGLKDFSNMATDGVAQSYIERCKRGERIRTPDEAFQHRLAQNEAAEQLRARWRRRDTFCGTPGKTADDF